MKRLAAVALLGALAFQANAATITWDPADNVTSTSDVIRVGGRFAAERMNGGSTNINGVTFRARGAFGTISYSSGQVWGGDIICPSNSIPPVCDDYRAMLRGVSWQPSGATYVIAISNLVVGTDYKVQIWSSSADGNAAGATVT